jgi:hypothetical protein
LGIIRKNTITKLQIARKKGKKIRNTLKTENVSSGEMHQKAK